MVHAVAAGDSFPGRKSGARNDSRLWGESAGEVNLPQRPEKVELDPDLWVLSDKTSVARQ
jgi:hypothetical protein